jgi:hypothetical protein
MPNHTNAARRNAANLCALRCGVPADRVGIDAMWVSLAKKLNATLPKAQDAIEARRTSSTMSDAKPIQAAVDWTAIVADLNAGAGLKASAESCAS